MSKSWNSLSPSLKNKISEQITAPAPPTPPPPANLSGTQYIASGAFGAAVKPALPNYNASTGQWVEYPENITKIFFSEIKKNKAVKKQRTAKNLLKNNNLRINDYKYKGYTVKNLPLNLQSKLPRSMTPNTSLNPVRLPNLGKDIYEYVMGLEVYEQYKKVIMDPLLNIPFSDSLYEINKLIYNVSVIYTKGYIHGDIKIENIMMKNDGSLTLIDYDHFDTFSNFYNYMSQKFKISENPLIELEGFGATFNQPPESFLFYLLDYIESLINNNTNISTITTKDIFQKLKQNPAGNKIFSRITDYVNYNSKFVLINNEKFLKNLHENLIIFIEIYKRNKETDVYNFFEKFFLNKFDVFSLGVALYFCYKVFYSFMFYNEDECKKIIQNKIEKENINIDVNYMYIFLNDIKNNIIDKMLDFNYKKRLNLIDAFNIYQNKYNEYENIFKQSYYKRSRPNNYNGSKTRKIKKNKY
jgi:serine/threonine protein kinase